MLHTAATALLALALGSTPFVPRGSPAVKPAPVEQPKPPPPTKDKPDHDRPDHDRPDTDHPHPDHGDRGTYYPQDGSHYREDPAVGIIRRNMSQIDSCFAQVRAQAPSLQGVVTVEWDVTIDGYVDNARVVENTLGATGGADCVLQTVKTWQFRNGSTTYPGHMSHTFHLRSAP